MFQKLVYFYYMITLTPMFLLEKNEEKFIDYALKNIRKSYKKEKVFVVHAKKLYAHDYAYERKRTLIDTMKKQPHALVLGYTPKDFAYIHKIRS